MKKYLALKIDVDTLKGTRLGVPALIELLKKHRAGATFLFSLGPDHTGRAIKRVFRKGFLPALGHRLCRGSDRHARAGSGSVLGGIRLEGLENEAAQLDGQVQDRLLLLARFHVRNAGVQKLRRFPR